MVGPAAPGRNRRLISVRLPDWLETGICKEQSVARPHEEQIIQLRAAIAAQEAMRPALGDVTVELSLKPLRALLESLLNEQDSSAGGEETSRNQLLAELQNYIPKQLADKIRA